MSKGAICNEDSSASADTEEIAEDNLQDERDGDGDKDKEPTFHPEKIEVTQWMRGRRRKRGETSQCRVASPGERGDRNGEEEMFRKHCGS
ncbi:hypothetical protein IMY05_003G0123800 [Salix suchowensis]|nr:hypothetical protein IMY05_003G0123800 [Salix suchowensis]